MDTKNKQKKDARGLLGDSYDDKLEHFETNPSLKFPE